MTTTARILIVDDDLALLEALPEALRLRMKGVEIDICESASAALERIEASDYDAIVTDIKMPGMDGLALLAAINEKHPGIPTLLITGHGERDLAVKALRGGAFDYFSKPIDRDHFVASLERAIRTRRLHRQAEEDEAVSLHGRRAFGTNRRASVGERSDGKVGAVREQAPGSILVVDDDDAFREIASRILQQAGYTTYEAATGEDALVLAHRERPELVLLDVRLGGRPSGHEVCRMLKDKLRPEPAILFVSGARTESLDRVGGLLVGADDYVLKPFAADELLARVRVLLRRSTPQQAAAPELTSRELEVASLLKDGHSRSEIARKLAISPTTAQKHIEHLLAKLGV